MRRQRPARCPLASCPPNHGVPLSLLQLERMLGTWRQYKTEHESGSAAVPPGHVGFKGQPCPLAGAPVAKNTRCPATKKAFKACCGKTMRI